MTKNAIEEGSGPNPITKRIEEWEKYIKNLSGGPVPDGRSGLHSNSSSTTPVAEVLETPFEPVIHVDHSAEDSKTST